MYATWSGAIVTKMKLGMNNVGISVRLPKAKISLFGNTPAVLFLTCDVCGEKIDDPRLAIVCYDIDDSGISTNSQIRHKGKCDKEPKPRYFTEFREFLDAIQDMYKEKD